MRIRTAVAAMVLALAAGGGFPAGAWAKYKPVDSDIDPEVFKLDEEKILGMKLAEDVALVDDTGRAFTLADTRGVSTVLALSYFTCDGACPAFNADLGRLMLHVAERGRVKLGEEARVLTVSFDKNDTAATAKAFRATLNFPKLLNDSWAFAVFQRPEDLERLTGALGYKFFWSAQDQMFFHPNVFIFLTPEGRVSRVMHSSKVDATDMELAIVDSRFNRLKPSDIGTMAMSLCYSYNYKDGKYGLNYPMIVAFSSLFVGIGAFTLGALVIRNKQKAKEREL